MNNMLIAIDGFSGAGKGTLARGLSEHYGIKWLDTGKLYRIVGYEAIKCGIFDVDILESIACSISIDSIAQYDANVLSDENIGVVASKISFIPEVRAALLGVQREFAYNKDGAILDGRDIGTVVCPDAKCKVFVYASLALRAQRRVLELQKSGIKVGTIEEIYEIMQSRDERDSNRAFSPLIPAPDAYQLDTSDLDIRTMIQDVIGYINSKIVM